MALHRRQYWPDREYFGCQGFWSLADFFEALDPFLPEELSFMVAQYMDFETVRATPQLFDLNFYQVSNSLVASGRTGDRVTMFYSVRDMDKKLNGPVSRFDGIIQDVDPVQPRRVKPGCTVMKFDRVPPVPIRWNKDEPHPLDVFLLEDLLAQRAANRYEARLLVLGPGTDDTERDYFVVAPFYLNPYADPDCESCEYKFKGVYLWEGIRIHGLRLNWY